MKGGSVGSGVRPVLSVLSQEQIEQVHQYSLKILSDVGLRVDSSRALKIFETSKSVTIDGDRVLIQPELVAWALKSAPRYLDIYNRTGQESFRLGRDSTRFGIGTTNLFYQEPGTNEVTPFSRQSMKIGTRLGDSLDNYDLISTIGIVKDVHPELQDLVGALEMAANTTKPLVILISDPSQFNPCMDLLETLFGDLVSKPFLLPYFNPVTPLVINKDTGDKLIDTISRGLPLIYSNYSMVGTTTPITPAGTLSLLNAELLAGLVLSQLVQEGAAIVLGSLPAFFDMKALVDYYDPLTILLNAACAEIMDFYQIPHAGTSGSGVGWGMDLPASGMLWLNHLIACIGNTGISPFVGGSFGSKVFSPEIVVFADDIITQARRFSKGFILNDDTVKLEEIRSMGPGGNFLYSKTTKEKFKEGYYENKIFPNLSLEKWQDLGRPGASSKLTDCTIELINGDEPPDYYEELINKGEEFISSIQ
ncbi:trimethylamine methyltransferase family protein [Chloroflexota bacterium]